MNQADKPKEIQSLRDLQLDPLNVNRHSVRGEGMIEASLEECGWGDSITVDRNGVLISGEGRTERGVDMNMADNPIVVHSDGTRAIVHVRTDLDLGDGELAGQDSQSSSAYRARRLGMWLNHSHRASYTLDPHNLASLGEQGLRFDDMLSTDEIDEAIRNMREEEERGEGALSYGDYDDDAAQRELEALQSESSGSGSKGGDGKCCPHCGEFLD